MAEITQIITRQLHHQRQICPLCGSNFNQGQGYTERKEDFGKISPSLGDFYYCTHHIVMQLGELFSSKKVCGSHSVSTLIPFH